MAEMWCRLPVPPICERLIGFSIPQDDTVLVVSYEGVHLIRLGQPIAVESGPEFVEYDSYNSDSAVCQYRGRDWEIIGLHPGRPILTGCDGEQLILDARQGKLSVVRRGEPIWTTEFENFSGDWAAATFSSDGRFIILGCSYDFDFRVWKRVPDTEANAGD